MKSIIPNCFIFFILLNVLMSPINANDSTYINKRYKGGEYALRKIIIDNLIYPTESAERCIVGTSVSSMRINKTGEIVEIKILNPLRKEIDKAVIKALNKTKDGWLRDMDSNNDTIFYFQILFKLENIDFFKQQVKSPNLIYEITIIAYGSDSYKNFISDDKLIENININYNKKAYNELLPLLNEAIRRNPFYTQFYQLRILCYENLNMDQELIHDDTNKLIKYIDNKSIDDILVK